MLESLLVMCASDGLLRWTGPFDLALATGLAAQPKVGKVVTLDSDGVLGPLRKGAITVAIDAQTPSAAVSNALAQLGGRDLELLVATSAMPVPCADPLIAGPTVATRTWPGKAVPDGLWGQVSPGWASLILKSRVNPPMDVAALRKHGDQRCVADVAIGTDGVPASVSVRECDPAFHASTAEVLLQWRWEPPVDGAGYPVRAQTTVAVQYHLAP